MFSWAENTLSDEVGSSNTEGEVVVVEGISVAPSSLRIAGHGEDRVGFFLYPPSFLVFA